MTERDDYLLDPRAPVDPEIAALEKALAPLALRETPWRETPVVVHARRRWPWLVAAAVVLVGAVVAFAFPRDGGALRPLAPPRTFVAEKLPLKVPLGELAQIVLRPGSELAFEHWRADQALFTLRRGSLEAQVAPPPAVQPGFFRVGTKLGQVVDQGCRYELDLRDDGSARVVVTEGAVTFETKDRTIFVPAGAAALVTASGVATPTFTDADAELVKATAEFDAARDGGASLDRRFMTLKMVVAAARSPRDSLVLWHLLRDPEPEVRKVAEAELVRLVGDVPGDKTSKEGSFDAEAWLALLRLRVWR